MEDDSSLDKLIAKYKIPLAVGFVGLVLIVGGLFSSGLISKTFIKSTKYPSTQVLSAQQTSSIVTVDVSGAVENPGVYALPAGSRIEDAIKAAGGVSEEIDNQYLSKTINLAQRLSDGTKIYLPFGGDAAKSQNNVLDSGGEGQVSKSGIVNINLATLEELDKLPGVGPATAQKIIDGRPYGGIEELFTKKAVSRSVYEKIKGTISTY